jgi:hypothetical protein
MNSAKTRAQKSPKSTTATSGFTPEEQAAMK